MRIYCFLLKLIDVRKKKNLFLNIVSDTFMCLRGKPFWSSKCATMKVFVSCICLCVCVCVEIGIMISPVHAYLSVFSLHVTSDS